MITNKRKHKSKPVCGKKKIPKIAEMKLSITGRESNRPRTHTLTRSEGARKTSLSREVTQP